MCIYTSIMQIRAENQNLVSALSITINKILCQFFEFTQNLKRSQLYGFSRYMDTGISCDNELCIIKKEI